MIDNWRQLLRYHIQEKRVETDLHQTLAALARQVGDFEVPGFVAPDQPPVEQSGQDLDGNDDSTKEDGN